MEAMKMKLFVAVLVAMIGFSAVQHSAAAVDAPAPGPSSDASLFIPTFFASVALIYVQFGLSPSLDPCIVVEFYSF
ncbi:Arabinogalactan protein 14 [Hirschfeldia incana]|nr:Arabinogalactan protein 14 [Hirschfeldia incana]